MPSCSHHVTSYHIPIIGRTFANVMGQLPSIHPSIAGINSSEAAAAGPWRRDHVCWCSYVRLRLRKRHTHTDIYIYIYTYIYIYIYIYKGVHPKFENMWRSNLFSYIYNMRIEVFLMSLEGITGLYIYIYMNLNMYTKGFTKFFEH